MDPVPILLIVLANLIFVQAIQRGTRASKAAYIIPIKTNVRVQQVLTYEEKTCTFITEKIFLTALYHSGVNFSITSIELDFSVLGGTVRTFSKFRLARIHCVLSFKLKKTLLPAAGVIGPISIAPTRFRMYTSKTFNMHLYGFDKSRQTAYAHVLKSDYEHDTNCTNLLREDLIQVLMRYPKQSLLNDVFLCYKIYPGDRLDYKDIGGAAVLRLESNLFGILIDLEPDDDHVIVQHIDMSIDHIKRHLEEDGTRYPLRTENLPNRSTGT